MRNEVLIARIVPADGEPIRKNEVMKRFYAPIKYVLDDSQTVMSTYSASRKKDVAAYLAKLPMEPVEMYAMFDDTGKFCGTKQFISDMMGW